MADATDATDANLDLSNSVTGGKPIMNAPAPEEPQAPNLSAPPAMTPGQNNALMGGNPAQPPAPAGTPSVWKTITMGALWGLAGSAGAKTFGAGAAGGAAGVLEEKPAAEQRAAQAQSDIRFRDAQAAEMQADYALKEAQINNLPQKVQDEHAQLNSEIMTRLINAGFTPIADTGDDPQAAMATGRNLTQSQGGVPALFTLDLGGHHVSFDLNQIANNPQGLAILNRQRTDVGQAALTPQQFTQLYPTPQLRNNAIKGALDFANPVITDRKSLDQAKGILATMQAQPNPSQDLKDDIARLQKVVATGEDVVKGNEAEQNKAAADKIRTTIPADVEKATAVTTAEVKTKQALDNKPVYALQNGQTILTTQGEAQAAGLQGVRPVKQTDIDKDQHDIKVLNDIGIKSQNVSEAASAMDNKSWKQAYVAAQYLSDHPNTTTSALFKSGVLGNATPQTKAYIIAINSLRESSMGLQKVLTGTARTNETQLNALLNTLPGVEPDSGTVRQKLTAFDQNLHMLGEGLPTNTGVQLKLGPNAAQPAGGPPAGATMKVPGSDGKLHWSDGKRDLGVVQ